MLLLSFKVRKFLEFEVLSYVRNVQKLRLQGSGISYLLHELHVKESFASQF